MSDDPICGMLGCSNDATARIELDDGRRFMACERHANGKTVVTEL